MSPVDFPFPVKLTGMTGSCCFVCYFTWLNSSQNFIKQPADNNSHKSTLTLTLTATDLTLNQSFINNLPTTTHRNTLHQHPENPHPPHASWTCPHVFPTASRWGISSLRCHACGWSEHKGPRCKPVRPGCWFVEECWVWTGRGLEFVHVFFWWGPSKLFLQSDQAENKALWGASHFSCCLTWTKG